MRVVPETVVGRIEFCEKHVDAFTTNAVAIGTTAAAVAAWQAKVEAARAAYDAQQLAQAAARDATTNLNVALAALMADTSSIIKQVRARAGVSGDAVYALASLPVPRSPSARPAPGKPTDFSVSLEATGVLTLRWKCDNPRGTSGTMYQVYRRVGPAGEFGYVGGTGTKGFVDSTLPAGSSSVTYQIQAVRSTAVGPWAQFNVNFGVSGGGGTMTASVVESAPAKLAA